MTIKKWKSRQLVTEFDLIYTIQNKLKSSIFLRFTFFLFQRNLCMHFIKLLIFSHSYWLRHSKTHLNINWYSVYCFWMNALSWFIYKTSRTRKPFVEPTDSTDVMSFLRVSSNRDFLNTWTFQYTWILCVKITQCLMFRKYMGILTARNIFNAGVRYNAFLLIIHWHWLHFSFKIFVTFLILSFSSTN